MMYLSRKLTLIIFLLLLQISSQGQDIIAHYPFDNNAMDISGNNNNGIMIGGVQAAADRFGNPCGALLFNGMDGYIEVPNSRTLKSPVNTFSATCWFKMQTTTYNWLTMICKGGNSVETPDNPQYRVQVFQSPSQSTVSLNTEFTEYDNSFNSHLFQNDIWNFYALVYDGENVKTYLNGREIWRFSYSNPLVQNDEPLHIAKDIPGAIEFFNGCLDDLRIFSSALDEKEVVKIYNDNAYASFDHDFNLLCPDNINVNTDKNKCFAVIDFDQPLLDVKCGSAKIKQIAGPSTGSEFPIGPTTLIFEAESNFGIKKSCYSKVIVKDIEPPFFNQINDTLLLIEDASNGTIFNYSMPIAMDNCSSTVKLKNGMPSGSKFPEGKSILTFIATDNSGNQAELNYAVKVIKKSGSGLAACPENIRKANDLHKCGAIVNYSIPDSINQKALKLMEGNTSGSFYKVGDTKNRYKNSDSYECSFMVTVFDDEKPVIKCQSDTTIFFNKTQKGARFYYPKPKATDNCKVDSLNQINGLKSGEIFPIGITENIFIAKDLYGNSAQCSFTVTVIDTTKIEETFTETVFIKNVLKDSIKYRKRPLEFNKCVLTMMLYDDSQQDMDTISVYFNGKEIIQKELIKIKKNGTLNRALILEPGINNYFIFKAWNEGTISPNTLRVEFYEGYYLDKMTKLKRKNPVETIVMHAKVGVASAISLKCKN